jgi:hypothetical protein
LFVQLLTTIKTREGCFVCCDKDKHETTINKGVLWVVTTKNKLFCLVGVMKSKLKVTWIILVISYQLAE